MCLLAFSLAEDGAFLLAANRDEFWARATAPAAPWAEDPDVVAGRDLAGGGTWLGARRGGRVAALTNYRDPAAFDAARPSRGALAAGFLLDPGASAEGWAGEVAARAARYNPFHLLVGDRAGLFVVSGRSGAVRRLESGIHAISNGDLDAPWPKMERVRMKLASLLVALQPSVARPPTGAARPAGSRRRLNATDEEALFSMLKDAERAPDGELPDTGVGLELERVLSAPFIATPEYGTRSSTLVIRDAAGAIRFVERTFRPDGSEAGTRSYAL